MTFQARWTRIRSCFVALLQVLWACRVSLFSILLPGGVIIGFAQGRDLFSFFWGPIVGNNDIRNAEVATLGYWLIMVLATYAFWAYPVHASARYILYDPYWLFPRDEKVANDNLEMVRRLYRPLIIWVPRVLATMPFLILAVAAHEALDDLPGQLVGDVNSRNASTEKIRQLLLLLQFCFPVSAALTLTWLSIRPNSLGRTTLGPLAPESEDLTERYRTALGNLATVNNDLRKAHFWLALVTAGLALTLALPQTVTLHASLALIVPIVAGAWVPIFTRLALSSHRQGMPIIFGALVLFVVLGYSLGDNHDISLTESTARPRINLLVAANRWMSANGCTARTLSSCPHPIIVSTAGGASRAGFFTLTVLGDLLDNPSFDKPIPGVADANAKARYVINRLFAVSGVSGGSVGAAIFAAAISNSEDGAAPCRTDVQSDFWFRKGKTSKWRDCLQAIMAEDFLSETIVGLSFRDNLNFLHRFLRWPDRAFVLEKSWTRAFEKWVKKTANDPNFVGLDLPFTQYQPEEGRWRPLLILNGTSVSTGRRIITTSLAPVWPARTLLVDEKEAKQEEERLFMDAYDFYEVLRGDKTCQQGKCDAPEDISKDVSLATAADNSARFPIISPPGTLRGHRGSKSFAVVDRIIDGGYYENDGITTTIDLVRALTKIGLRPVVVHIANDPLPYVREVKTKRADKESWRLRGPTVPSAEDRSWLLGLRGPLGGLLATRGARSSYALHDLQDMLADEAAFAEILVYGEPSGGFSDVLSEAKYEHGCHDVPPASPGMDLKPVSMSWWLSQPVQEYLDAQLALARNCAALDRVRSWLNEPSTLNVAAPTNQTEDAGAISSDSLRRTPTITKVKTIRGNRAR